MRRRTFLIGAAGGAGALILGSCDSAEESAPGTTSQPGTGSDQEPAARPTLRLAGGDSGFPSPFAYMRGGGYMQMSYIYDTLMWKDASGELLPWLAESYQQADDARSYTFTLHPDILWHDGQPLTPDDVAFTFEYFRSQTISPQVIIQPLPEIQEVRVTGERTVEFRLATPLAPFFGFGGVGSVPIVPRHIWSSIPDAAKERDPAALVGSGPYRLESYSQGEGSYLYTANDDYFLGRPFVKRIENRPVGDELSALLSDELDAGGGSGLRPEILEPFRDNPDLEVLDAPLGNMGSGLFWNLAKGGALADVQFRRACAMAIDRQDMVQRLFGGNGTPGNPGWIPPANPFHTDVEQYSFDRGSAEALLDGAGYTAGDGGVRQGGDGQPLRFTLLVTTPVSPVTDLVVGALKAVGIELTTQALDTPTFNQRVIAGDTEMSIINFGGMNTDHAAGYLLQVYSSKTKTTQHAQGYVNPQVDRLCDQQQTEIDESKRRETVAQIQRLIAEDLPILPLVYPNAYTIFNKNAFSEWYYTEGGVASTVPVVTNKHVFITGRKTGLEIRPIKEGG